MVNALREQTQAICDGLWRSHSASNELAKALQRTEDRLPRESGVGGRRLGGLDDVAGRARRSQAEGHYRAAVVSRLDLAAAASSPSGVSSAASCSPAAAWHVEARSHSSQALGRHSTCRACRSRGPGAEAGAEARRGRSRGCAAPGYAQHRAVVAAAQEIASSEALGQ